jgi:hypothetical protein
MAHNDIRFLKVEGAEAQLKTLLPPAIIRGTFTLAPSLRHLRKPMSP